MSDSMRYLQPGPHSSQKLRWHSCWPRPGSLRGRRPTCWRRWREWPVSLWGLLLLPYLHVRPLNLQTDSENFRRGTLINWMLTPTKTLCKQCRYVSRHKKNFSRLRSQQLSLWLNKIKPQGLCVLTSFMWTLYIIKSAHWKWAELKWISLPTLLRCVSLVSWFGFFLWFKYSTIRHILQIHQQNKKVYLLI